VQKVTLAANRVKRGLTPLPPIAWPGWPGVAGVWPLCLRSPRLRTPGAILLTIR